MKEKAYKYFTAIGIVFFLEGINQACLYPVSPYLLKFEDSGNTQSKDQEEIHWQTHQEQSELAFKYAFFQLAYYGAQFIGMFFWSAYLKHFQLKNVISFLILMNSVSMFLTSYKFSLASVLVFRSMVISFNFMSQQGFFNCSVGIAKLTIDNVFNPQKDMFRVVDIFSLWCLGLVLGSSLSGVLSNAHKKIFSTDLDLWYFKNYPFTAGAGVALTISLIGIIAIKIIFPKFEKDYQQYKKMQSTLFFQQIFFLSQNEFTNQVTRHQRTRETFNVFTFKKILWLDRNFLFALINQGIANFVFFGFYQLFPLYCVTSFNLNSELYISIPQCASIAMVFYYQMFCIDINFFEQKELTYYKNSQLIKAWSIGFISIVIMFVVRFAGDFNSYLLIGLLCIAHSFFMVCFCNIMNITALNCGEDADLARNISQLNNAMSKVLGPFILIIATHLNFQQMQLEYAQYLYSFITCIVLILIAFLTICCLDMNWQNRMNQFNKKLLDSSNTSREVFA